MIGTRYWNGGREVNLDYLPSTVKDSASVKTLDIATHLNFPGEQVDVFPLKIKIKNYSNTYVLKEQLRCKSTMVMFNSIVLCYIGVNPSNSIDFSGLSWAN